MFDVSTSTYGEVVSNGQKCPYKGHMLTNETDQQASLHRLVRIIHVLSPISQ